MKQRYLSSTICKFQVFAIFVIAISYVSCNEFAKSDLAESVQRFNEKSLPQKQAEGLEWTSISYNKVLDQVVLRFTFDEDYFDAEETIALFEENKDELKASLAPVLAESGKTLKLDGTAVKVVYGFNHSKRTFETFFSGDEIDQLVK